MLYYIISYDYFAPSRGALASGEGRLQKISIHQGHEVDCRLLAAMLLPTTPPFTLLTLGVACCSSTRSYDGASKHAPRHSSCAASCWNPMKSMRS